MSQTSRRRFFKMSSDDSMIARQLFSKSVISVLPHIRLRQVLEFDGKNLHVENLEQKFEIPEHGVHVVGFGKAIIGMAAELQRILGQDKIKKMILSVPDGICDHLTASGQQIQLPKNQNGLILIQGAKNNIPDLNAFKAAKMISETISNLNKDELVIVLVSGGGSALLPAPKNPLSLEEKANLTMKLSRAGASIQEMNSVRIQLSELKGGKLAKKASPAKVLSFILSDIINDPLELISSGPTIVSKTEMTSAIEIFKKFNIEPTENAIKALSAPEDSNARISSRSENVLLANNKIALETCLDHANVQGLDGFVLTNELSGEAKKVGMIFGTLGFEASRKNPNLQKIQEILKSLGTPEDITNNIIEKLKDLTKPVCLITGGETIVKVTGNGRGGRNQEIVLAAMIKFHELQSQNSENLEKIAKFTFLSAGTDGIDGPTEAAGAVADQDMILEARNQGLDPYNFLHDNDSNTFFKHLSQGQHLIVTGHTGTNVMDLQILIINPKL